MRGLLGKLLLSHKVGRSVVICLQFRLSGNHSEKLSPNHLLAYFACLYELLVIFVLLSLAIYISSTE